MDSINSSRRTGSLSISDSEHLSGSGRASEESSMDEPTINLSPVLSRSSPRVYSANPARGMMNDRLVRLKETINRTQAENDANNLQSESLNKWKAYVAIQTEIRKAIDDENSVLRKYPAELSAVKEAYAFLENLINEDINYYKTGPSKHLWTLSAGAASYLLTFCSGTLLANGLDMPWLSPIVIAICWTFANAFRR